ncbi:response regulator transcription factor [Symbioplanes lichenis]|uniref:response regulator transcription factor n=1 Tax=Symbioplanes lichenis TaxID=1629072 RepID=UPI002739747B|nr:response regulator transcription factor [Actinoplanes lichenis]
MTKARLAAALAAVTALAAGCALPADLALALPARTAGAESMPVEELLGAVRVVARGDALIDPSVTRRLVTRFADGIAPATADEPRALDRLTAREREILLEVARGHSNAEIAGHLFVGEQTVKTHVSPLLMKLGLRDRIQAVIHAYENGLL